MASGWGGPTSAMPFTCDTSWWIAASDDGVAFSTSSRFGVSWKGGNWARITLSTCLALALSGSTCASTEVNLRFQNGSPSTIRMAAVTVAIATGRRMTKRESRYQKPSWVTVASRSARRCRKLGAHAFTR